MVDLGYVKGSEAQAKPLIIGKDTVYVHKDITQEETEDGTIVYSYHEIQYDKDEYIQMMALVSDNLQDAVLDLYEMIMEV